jgi:hypothetical protein
MTSIATENRKLKTSNSPMPSTYQASPLLHHLHEPDRVSHIPLRGIPQIPEAANQWWKTQGNWELPTNLQRLCDEQIAEAMLEHRRRREAQKLGMDLEQYFPDDAADLDDDRCAVFVPDRVRSR